MAPEAALRRHWPEYLIEACLLGAFMVSALGFTVLLEHPASPARAALPDATLRRALMGLAMGGTAIALVCSPWGQRSGAHFNPALTLTFLRLGRIEREAQPDLHFVARDDGCDQRASIRTGHFRCGERGRHDGCTGMQRAGRVRVVEIERVRERAIHHRGASRAVSGCVADYGA